MRPTPLILLLLLSLAHNSVMATTDYMTFAEGAIPVEVGGQANVLKAGIEQALVLIDGNPGGKVITPKPGGPDTTLWFVYQLPAPTTFTRFAVPGISETPSPSQTFFREVEISGSSTGPTGPFEPLASASLAEHKRKDELTFIVVGNPTPVSWVRVTLSGGINLLTDKTFFEFSEIIGEGTRAPVPVVDAFTGKWKGRGVLLELKQEGTSVSGCYDREGDLQGTVRGNLLQATGTNRTSGVPSSFVLAVGEDGGITGVRSTNGAPFRLYTGDTAPGLVTECSSSPARPPGCGDNVHGIQFDFDSDVIRPDSAPVLDALYAGLKDVEGTSIQIVGHTSSEGAEDYNLELSRRRAASVVAALVTRGIDRARLGAHGAGEASPIADNSSETGRSLNRRVEIRCL
ncbi:MAG: OmpA family protein [Pseudomonadota bacterium]